MSLCQQNFTFSLIFIPKVPQKNLILFGAPT